jgi:uncharacterized membrane protein
MIDRMAGRRSNSPAGETMDTNRLETFADGVFGIAATLLIVRVSVTATGPQLGHALVDAWPEYAAYALSFLMIGIWWVNHHAFLKAIDRVDRTFLFANLALLACIAFIPFPTNLVAEHFGDEGLQAATLTYTLTLTATAGSMAWLWFHAARGRRLIVATADQRVIDRTSRYIAPGVVGCGAAALIALWSPYASLALIAASALFYVFGGARAPAISA